MAFPETLQTEFGIHHRQLGELYKKNFLMKDGGLVNSLTASSVQVGKGTLCLLV